MGNAIKKAANATIDFFKKAGEFIYNTSKKVIEVIVNGSKKVATFFKKIISYCRDGIKIVGKLFYCAGKQAIHTLTGKKGIPYLKEFFNDLKKKNIEIKDQNNKEIDTNNYLNHLENQMVEGDTLKLTGTITKKETKNEEDSFRDFENEEEDPNSVLGLNLQDSTAKIGDEEINLSNIKSVDTSSGSF